MKQEFMRISESTTVNILGAEYAVTIKKYDKDDAFHEKCVNGYCSGSRREIVICDMTTYPEWEHEPQWVIESQQKETIRHEIIHAFFRESGLWANANPVDGSWAENEEMVDWFAIQGPKIYKAWQEAGAV